MIRKFIFRNKLFTFAFFIFIASVLFSSCQKTQSTRTEVALGTFCTISLFENASNKLYDRIFEKINQIENLMSTSISNSEISKINHLKVDQIYETMNYLNVIINDKANDERWFVIHTDTIPLLMLIVQGMEFFRAGK